MSGAVSAMRGRHPSWPLADLTIQALMEWLREDLYSQRPYRGEGPGYAMVNPPATYRVEFARQSDDLVRVAVLCRGDEIAAADNPSEDWLDGVLP